MLRIWWRLGAVLCLAVLVLAGWSAPAVAAPEASPSVSSSASPSTSPSAATPAASPTTAAEPQMPPTSVFQRLQALVGIVLILGVAYLCSSNRSAINMRTLVWGLLLQFVFALLVLRGGDISAWMAGIVPLGDVVMGSIAVVAVVVMFLLSSNRNAQLGGGLVLALAIIKMNFLERFFNSSRDIVSQIIGFSLQGAEFVFGSLAKDNTPTGFIFAFRILPTIIFVSSLFAILYYFGIMQRIVGVLARFMTRFMGASGAESTSVAASIFMGQTEAPLTIRPYLPDLTLSELMTIMVSGMAHVAAGIMPGYVLVGHVDIKHLLVAVIMTAPGAILLAKMFVPETEQPQTGAEVHVEVPITDINVVDAAARGASEGGMLALNVAFMLIAFLAIIALLNGCIGLVHNAVAWFPAHLEDILGLIFSPIAWCLGVSWHDAPAIGSLLGTRMVANEFVAFIQLGGQKATLDPRSFIIATYGLCGFANLSSIAIQVGGIGSLAQNRRHDLARLGVRAMLAGTLANFLSAAIAALLI